jgi:acetyl-CoA carboxylase biotin carboxyl carrier protein
MHLTHTDVKKILEIVDAATHLDEIEFVHNGLHFHFQRGVTVATTQHQAVGTAQPVSSRPATTAGFLPAAQNKQRDERETAIRAPMVGTFYRSSTTDEAPLVERGRQVRAHDTVAQIKAGTCFIPIKAGVDGVVNHIFPSNGDFVEFDQLLFTVATA